MIEIYLWETFTLRYCWRNENYIPQSSKMEEKILGEVTRKGNFKRLLPLVGFFPPPFSNEKACHWLAFFRGLGLDTWRGVGAKYLVLFC